MRKTATALACAALAAGAVVVSAPAATAAPGDPAETTVEVASGTFYQQKWSGGGEPSNQFPIKWTTTVDVDPATFWAAGSTGVTVPELTLPAGVNVDENYFHEYEPSDTSQGTTVPSGAQATPTLNGQSIGFTVKPVDSSSAPLAQTGETTTLTLTSHTRLTFDAPGTYQIGDQTVVVKDSLAPAESGGVSGDRRWEYIKIDPYDTQPVFGGDPSFALDLYPTMNAHEPCGDISLAYHKADGTIVDIDLGDADTCTAAPISLDNSYFRDANGDYIGGALRFEYPDFGTSVIEYNIEGRMVRSRAAVLDVNVTEKAGNPGEEIVVTPIAPRVDYLEPCGVPGHVMLSPTTGIEYREVSRDDFTAVYDVIVKPGYVLAPGSPTSYTLDVSVIECETAQYDPKIGGVSVVKPDELNEGVSFPFSGFPADTDITFEFRSGDGILSTNVVRSSDLGEGVLNVFARLSDGSSVPSGTEFIIVASGEGFENVLKTFVARDGDAPVDPDPENPTDPDPENPVTPDNPIEGNGEGQLAQTGFDSQATTILVGGAAAALLAGGALLALRRRNASE